MAYLREVSEALETINPTEFERAVSLLESVRRRGGIVYAIGNGGSAATASHLACDLAKTSTGTGRQPLRVFALSDNLAVLTAWANDVSFADVFASQLSSVLEPDDVVVAISVSGQSPNILAGLRVARRVGAATLGLLGAEGAALRLVDIALRVPCYDFGVVETVHLGVVHALAATLRTMHGRPQPTVDQEAASFRAYGP